MKIKLKKIKLKKEMKIGLIAAGAIILIVVVLLIINSVSKENTVNQPSPNNTLAGTVNAVLYEDKFSFVTFTDPKENAFTINLPKGWTVSKDSGLIRPYIDAGVLLQVTSPENQGFFYMSPLAIYTVPNGMLDFAGFTEGKYYDPSNGLAKPMLVKKYTDARDFLNQFVNQLNVDAQILEVVDRPDLIKANSNPLITEQSAAEITYITKGLTYKLIDYNYLMESSGIGIWAASLFGYYSSENLFNETEYLVLKSQESFKVNAQWADKEAQEVNKRAGIISSTQVSVSDSISSSFEYRTDSQDRINEEWSKTTLGVEEVYNPETGETRYPDSGANYYWADNKNNIYGTQTDESPFPLEDMTKLEIKKEV